MKKTEGQIPCFCGRVGFLDVMRVLMFLTDNNLTLNTAAKYVKSSLYKNLTPNLVTAHLGAHIYKKKGRY
jgi:hypothetical protein